MTEINNDLDRVLSMILGMHKTYTGYQNKINRANIYCDKIRTRAF